MKTRGQRVSVEANVNGQVRNIEPGRHVINITWHGQIMFEHVNGSREVEISFLPLGKYQNTTIPSYRDIFRLFFQKTDFRHPGDEVGLYGVASMNEASGELKLRIANSKLNFTQFVTQVLAVLGRQGKSLHDLGLYDYDWRIREYIWEGNTPDGYLTNEEFIKREVAKLTGKKASS
jgi:hypothetical protein